MTMLEKLATAIGSHLYGYVNPDDTPNTWATSVDVARAALEAIRVPSAVVAYAATGDGWNHVEGGFDALWQSAIDAILNEETT